MILNETTNFACRYNFVSENSGSVGLGPKPIKTVLLGRIIITLRFRTLEENLDKRNLSKRELIVCQNFSPLIVTFFCLPFGSANVYIKAYFTTY